MSIRKALAIGCKTWFKKLSQSLASLTAFLSHQPSPSSQSPSSQSPSSQQLEQLLQRGWRSLFPHLSTDYRSWRQEFLAKRLRLCLWVALPCALTFLLQNFYDLFLKDSPDRDQRALANLGSLEMVNLMKTLSVLNVALIVVLLAGCLWLQQLRWGKRHPGSVLLLFSWSVSLFPQVLWTANGLPFVPGIDWNLLYLLQVTLVPVRWELHFISQVVAIAYFVIVNTTLGLTMIGKHPVYSLELFVYWFWICFVSDLAVFLYEKLKRGEFEARRELQVFLHAVTHDLRTPVMGTTVVLNNLLKRAVNGEVNVKSTVLERLLEGSDRQLTLIHAVLEAHTSDMNAIVLNRQSVQLSTLVDGVLTDLQPLFLNNQIIATNHISPTLPNITADITQLWRVFSNLLMNALKHNPHGIRLDISAELWHNQPSPPQAKNPKSKIQNPKSKTSVPMILCTISDTGIGIPADQCDRLFNLYARGDRSRYMPGLGLGLYLCKQIITAHGGEIGVWSTVEQGSTFWFTLPLAASAE